VSHKINAPASKVWEVLDKFSEVYMYHPFVKHSESLNQQARGLGAERSCHFEDGNKIKERIIAYEKGNSYQVEIYDPGNFPLRRAVALLEVKPDGNHKSTVIFNMSFKPKYGPAGWLMAKMMMKKQFASILKHVLKGLDTHLQTGGVVGKNGAVLKAAQL
jgi:hypothetical protein